MFDAVPALFLGDRNLLSISIYKKKESISKTKSMTKFILQNSRKKNGSC